MRLRGGALGLLFASWSMTGLERMIPSGLAGAVELRVDLRVLAFAAAVSILTGLLFGLAPACAVVANETARAAARWDMAAENYAMYWWWPK